MPSLALDQECAAIERELRLTPGRDDFEFRSKWAVTVDELMRHLLDLQPTILHFSGHGDTQGILLRGDDGAAQPVSPSALAQLVRTTTSATRLVVLNACFSDGQAEALRDAVGCAIGMRGTIDDDAARSFAVGLYRALGHRKSVGNAYHQAEATLAAKGLDAMAAPRCLIRPGLDADTLVLGSPAATAPGRSPSTSADDLVRSWLEFGLERHGRVMVVGFREASIPLALDRIFVPLHVYADRRRTGAGPDQGGKRGGPDPTGPGPGRGAACGHADAGALPRRGP